MLINELAKLAGVNKQTVRFYEKLGLLKSIPRQAGSRTYGDYDNQSLVALSKIKLLQSLGFSLNEIGEYIHDSIKDERNAEEREAILRVKLVDLESRREKLDLLIDNVKDALRKYE